VLGYVQQKLVPIPVNINTVNALFNLNISNQLEMKTWLSLRQIPCPHTGCSNAEEMAKSRVGVQLYEEIFKDYTLKQWDKQPSELDSLVTSRIPVRTDFDNRYFTDRYQALPEKGYTKWIESVLDHPNIEILLKEDFFKKQKIWESNCGKIFFTGPIDRYFSSVGFPMLEYRGIDFKVKKHFNSGFIQTASVINYPGARFPFTRIVEYKHFLNQPSPNSVTVAEYSKTMGPYDDPYYPVPTTRNHALYKKYQKLATELENEKNIFFIGRLANYKYFNMDETISNALKLFYSLSKVPCDFCPIPRESSRN
jgi:UDP-galactopyranose mutase